MAGALLADFIAPFPEHRGAVVDFANFNRPPEWPYLMGTDLVGRDLFSRILYAYRISLLLGVVVLAIATRSSNRRARRGLLRRLDRVRAHAHHRRVSSRSPPLGARDVDHGGPGAHPHQRDDGRHRDVWWPWYARLVYNVTRAEKEEGYVLAAELIGASHMHVTFREILPNCLSAVVTKMTLDLGFVILIASSLSFLGLGVQPPTPDLGSMVADGARYLPDSWWLTIFPGLAILVAVFGFNLVGDALREVLGRSSERRGRLPHHAGVPPAGARQGRCLPPEGRAVPGARFPGRAPPPSCPAVSRAE